MTFVFLLAQFLVISTILLGMARIGMTPVVVVVATMQLFQAILGATMYWEFAEGLLLSPGSAVYFASNIAILLYVYETRGTGAARTIFYTIVGSNLVIVLLSTLIYAHTRVVTPINFLDFPPELFRISLSAAVVGTTVLALTQLIALTIFNMIRSRWPNAPSPFPMTAALTIALVVDTFGYLIPLFWSDPNLSSMLASGTISKGAAGLIFGITWGAWAQLYRSQHSESLRQLFEALMWADETESFRSNTAEVYGKKQSLLDSDRFISSSADASRGDQNWTEDNYRRWLTSLPYGVCVFRDGTITLTNENFAAQVGERAGTKLDGSPIGAYLHKRDLDELERARSMLDDDVKNPAYEHELRRADGTTLTVESVLIKATLQGSEASILMTRDITEVKQLRDQMSHTKRLSALGTLAATIAHEINNPLSFILANHSYMLRVIEQLKAELSPELAAEFDELADAATDSQEGAQRIRTVVQELGNFTRTDSDEISTVNVATIIESSVNMAMPQIKHRAQLACDIDEIPPVDANDQRLGQVVLNLLINAAQAIEPGAKTENEIHISASAESNAVYVRIRDTGCGIDSQIQDRIMEPFFTTKTADKGTGLGLATCQSIIESFDGKLGFESTPGEGSTFWFRLPVASSPQVEEDIEPPPESDTAGRGNILLIDDEQMLARSFSRMLDGHEITTCSSGGQALALLEENDDFDIIFCDIMMPNMTGIQFYEELQTRNPSLIERLVFITGGAYTDATQSFLESVDPPCQLKPLDWYEVHTLVDDKIAK